MNALPGDNDRLWCMADAICMGTASDEELCELEARVLADDNARSLYIAYCQLDAALEFELGGQRVGMLTREKIRSEMLMVAANDFSAATPASCPIVPAAPGLGFLSATLHGTIGYFSTGMPLAYLLATVITGLGLLIGSLVHVSEPEQIARQSIPRPSPLSPLPSVIGRITGMVDCQWNKGRGAGTENPTSYIPHPKSLVAMGDKFALASGLIEITYDTGAKVILQGPVTYEVESNGGYLAVGKLTGKLEKGSGCRVQGSEAANHKSEIINQKSSLSTIHYPLFTIKTPTATVTDLGTEFFVEVKPDQVTEVTVIRGAVETVRDSRTGGVPVRERLVAGEAIRFASPSAPPERISIHSSDATRSLTATEVWRELRDARRWQTWLHPVGLVATAYHRVWGSDGKLLAENSRQQAFRMATDDVFGRGENDGPACSSFDTMSANHSKTAFVGLRYGRLTRFDQIMVFMGRQMGDGGNWSATPRVFILKNNVDTNQTPPEDDPANWRELSLRQVYGAAFGDSASANPGAVVEIALTGCPAEHRIGYGWALGDVPGNGPAHYVSITELRAYGEELSRQQVLQGVPP